MVNYQNTKIYKIESHLGPKIYIGSTTKEYLSQRMDSHRGGYKQWKQGILNKIMSYDLFDEYGVENCKIVLLEACPCNIFDEKASREAHYIKTLECVNKNIPGRDKHQYYKDNKCTILEYKKLHYQDNKEQKIEYNKQYNIVNKIKIIEQKSTYITCTCGKSIQQGTKARHERTKIHIKTLENQK